MDDFTVSANGKTLNHIYAQFTKFFIMTHHYKIPVVPKDLVTQFLVEMRVFSALNLCEESIFLFWLTTIILDSFKKSFHLEIVDVASLSNF